MPVEGGQQEAKNRLREIEAEREPDPDGHQGIDKALAQLL
jgi:hypothetical protein